MASIIFWAVLLNFSSPFSAALVTLVITIVIDVLGFFPTIFHAWQFPEEEDKIAWSIGMFGAAVNLFAVGDWTYTVNSAAIAIYPVYNFALIGVIVVALWVSPNRHT
jgi:hypothetical protein